MGSICTVSDLWEKLSEERKEQQDKGLLPEWYSTGGWQMFKEKYLYQADSFKEQAIRIAKTAAKHLQYKDLVVEYEKIFFDMIWNGWLSCSTPVLANMGTDRGMPVSCSGTVVEDSIFGFYDTLKENAILTQEGFGTAAYLGKVRPRGSKISRGGKSAGILPVLNDYRQMSMDVSQGGVRRGSIALYIPIDHGDFWEVVNELEKEPESLNIGWCVSDEFTSKLVDGDEDALARYKRVLRVKMVTGKGYFFFTDKTNRHNPQMYKDRGLEVITSQLCQEITLYADHEHTFTCVLSSLNLARYNEWKDTNAIFDATVFLDCVASEFLEKARNIKGLEKAVRFTEKSRALGLGVAGFHTYLMQEGIPFESFEAHMFNTRFFKEFKEKSLEASQWLAKTLGEPEWCKGYGVRGTHRCVRKNTKILTKKGSLTIGELLGERVSIWNGYEWSEVTPFKTGSNEKLWRVYTSDGRYLDCTEDHLWMVASPERSTYGGNKTFKVETSKLRIGDCLIKKLGAVTDGYLGELPHAYTNGFFSGDGSINCSRGGKYPRNELRLYDSKEKVKDRICWKSKNTWNASIKGEVRGIRGYVTDDLLPKYEVPINYDLKSRLEWLAGIIDSDGSSNAKGISISTARECFADNIMELLTTLGCHGHKAKRIRKDVHGGGCCFIINITMLECNTLINLGMVLSRVKYKPSKGNSVQRLSSKQFVKVVDVEDLGINEDTYCLTDPKNGSCVFNGILTSQCAIAPTKSTALLIGGVSEGINPDPAMVFTQASSAGEIQRVNPTLLKIMKEKKVYNKQTINDIINNRGSVQHVSWLDDKEKKVFKTAFEIDQRAVLRMAGIRGKFLDQWQSLNLFFSAEEDAKYIAKIHEEAFLDESIRGLYYIYSKAGVVASKDDCEACQ